jgi:hypothetical protein
MQTSHLFQRQNGHWCLALLTDSGRPFCRQWFDLFNNATHIAHGEVNVLIHKIHVN